MNLSRPPGRVVHLQPTAPPKPAEGEPCNGCGVCCLAEPCPAGIVATRSTRGPCAVLRWDEDRGLYRCGLLAHADDARDGRIAAVLGTTWVALARRWIGAGRGCDCSLEVTPAVPDSTAHWPGSGS